MKFTAIYTRVSTDQQTDTSQTDEIRRYLDYQTIPAENQIWFSDKATGKNFDRPDWQKLEKLIDAGKVAQIIVWSMDRLGRTASGLLLLFEKMQIKGVNLVSLKENLDLSTPSGRLIAGVMASMAAYETEQRGLRVRAGQEAARRRGKTWGGSIKGRRHHKTNGKLLIIKGLREKGWSYQKIADQTGMSKAGVRQLFTRYETGV